MKIEHPVLPGIIRMPSSRVVCPWCTAHPKSEEYFNHLNSKHHSLLWSGKNKVLLKTRITNKRVAPITIILPEPAHTIFACLGCMSAAKNYKMFESHEISCRDATLKALAKWKVIEDESSDVITKASVNILIDKFNLKVNVMRKRIKELDNQLKESDDEDESESEDEYDFRDEFASLLKGLGI